MSSPTFTIASSTLDSLNDPCGNNFIKNLTAFNNKLQTLDGNLQQNNNVLTDAVTQQTYVNGLIIAENNRIQDQQQSLTNAQTGQKRILNLNDSYRKKYNQYLKIIIAIVGILLSIWLLRLLTNIVQGLVPSFIFDILIILVVSIGLIYCYLVYSDIGRYDPLNYDELNLAPPPNATTGANTNLSGNVAPNSNITLNGGDLSNVAGCSGQSCCGTGTIWNSSTLQCSRQGFTTISETKSIHPNSPYEFTDYTPIN